jgi:hypothetical protein
MRIFQRQVAGGREGGREGGGGGGGGFAIMARVRAPGRKSESESRPESGARADAGPLRRAIFKFPPQNNNTERGRCHGAGSYQVRRGHAGHSGAAAAKAAAGPCGGARCRHGLPNLSASDRAEHFPLPWIQSHSATHGRLALRVPLRTSLMLAVPVACVLRPGSGRLTGSRRVAFKLDRPAAAAAAAAAMIGRARLGSPAAALGVGLGVGSTGPGTGMITGILSGSSDHRGPRAGSNLKCPVSSPFPLPLAASGTRSRQACLRASG